MKFQTFMMFVTNFFCCLTRIPQETSVENTSSNYGDSITSIQTVTAKR